MNTTGIWTDKDRLGGKPCIRGHRLSIAQLIAEVADGRSLKEIAKDFGIDYNDIWSAWVDLVNELCLLKINSNYIMSEETGTNCLCGTPISLFLMNILLDNRTPSEEAKNHDLDTNEIEGMLWNLASLLDRDWTNGPPKNIEQAISEGPT